MINDDNNNKGCQSVQHQGNDDGIRPSNVDIKSNNLGPANFHSSNHRLRCRSGYDAEKCRAHIAHQAKVSKIDRFVIQMNKAQEVELEIYDRLERLMDDFNRRKNRSIYDYMTRLNSVDIKKNNQGTRRGRKRGRKPKINIDEDRALANYAVTPMVDDITNGSNLKIVFKLITSKPSLPEQDQEDSKTTSVENGGTDEINGDSILGYRKEDEDEEEEVHLISNSFGLCQDIINKDPDSLRHASPDDYISELKRLLVTDVDKSRKILNNLGSIRQLFETLTSEHRLNLDMVYAAEEERQSSSVIRRSAYNLSIAALRATTTPIHVHPGPDH